MSISYVRRVGTAGTAVSQVQLVFTVGGGIQTLPGNHLIVVDGDLYGGPTPIIADSQSNTWQWDIPSTHNTHLRFASCRITNPLSTGDTITLNYSDSAAHGFCVFEVAGLHPTSWFENAIGFGGGSGSATESTYTPSVRAGGSFIMGAQMCQVAMGVPTYEVLTPPWIATGSVGASGASSSDFELNVVYRIPPLGGPFRVKSTFGGPRPWYALATAYRAEIPTVDLQIGGRLAW